MCGRYGITMTAHEAARRLEIAMDNPDLDELGPRYNVAPGTDQLTALGRLDDRTTLELRAIHWGFMPSWQTKPSKALVNMRLEKADSTFWNKAFRKRRCVIPANWYYEWGTKADNKGQPYAVQPDVDGFFLAGVWSLARALPAEHPLHGQRTFAIVTQPPSPDVAFIHHRMPVALDDHGAKAWLAPGEDSHALHHIIAQHAYTALTTTPVSTRVNRPQNDDPELLAPVTPLTHK